MENEIYGTVMVVGFDLIAILMCMVLFAEKNIWANIGGIVFAAIALWATIKVVAFWVRKIKSKFDDKQ